MRIGAETESLILFSSVTKLIRSEIDMSGQDSLSLELELVTVLAQPSLHLATIFVICPRTTEEQKTGPEERLPLKSVSGVLQVRCTSIKSCKYAKDSRLGKVMLLVTEEMWNLVIKCLAMWKARIV